MACAPCAKRRQAAEQRAKERLAATAQTDAEKAAKTAPATGNDTENQ